MLRNLIHTIRRRFDERRSYRRAFRALERLHVDEMDGLLTVEGYEHRSTIRR